jgi:hypothetical protein
MKKANGDYHEKKREIVFPISDRGIVTNGKSG